MIHPAFRNIKRLFDLSLKAVENEPARTSFDKYCMPLVEIKDFDALIKNKHFFDQTINNKQEAYEKIFEMSRNNDSRFVTRKWNMVNDQSNANYDTKNETMYNTEVLKSTFCD